MVWDVRRADAMFEDLSMSTAVDRRDGLIRGGYLAFVTLLLLLASIVAANTSPWDRSVVSSSSPPATFEQPAAQACLPAR